MSKKLTICKSRRLAKDVDCLAVTYPDIASQLVDKSLGFQLTRGSRKKVLWRCEHGHIWETSVNHRTHGSGCPYCQRMKPWVGETDLATTHPELVAELLDKSLGTELMSGSKKYVWWKCKYGHIWRARVVDRVNGHGCPYCTGVLPIVGENDLATTHPELVSQLVDNSLGTKLTSGSGKCVEWVCERGHVWKAPVYTRVKGHGCPYCAGQLPIVGETDLATTHPEIAEQLKDKSLGITVTAGSGKLLEWQCEHGHVWKARVSHRVHGNGCPTCKESSGERNVRAWLDKQGISYVEQWWHSGCKCQKPLTFDFAIFGQDNDTIPVVCIEYQGEQHYMSIVAFGGDERFESQKMHDDIKRAFCEEYGIKLIEIPYSFDSEYLVGKMLDACLKNIR